MYRINCVLRQERWAREETDKRLVQHSQVREGDMWNGGASAKMVRGHQILDVF